MCSPKCGGLVKKSGVDPWGVCGGTVKVTRFHYTLACTKCKKWVHNKCKEGKKDFRKYTKKERDNFTCKRCRFTENEGSGFVEAECLFLNEEQSFEAVKKFCYLEELLSEGGGADTAIYTRTSCRWKKFWELAPILINKKIKLEVEKKAFLGMCKTYLYVWD